MSAIKIPNQDRRHLEWFAAPFAGNLPGYINPARAGKFAVARQEYPGEELKEVLEYASKAQPPKPGFAYLRKDARTFSSMKAAEAMARKMNREFDFKRHMWDQLVSLGAKPSVLNERQLSLETQAGPLIISIEEDSIHTRFLYPLKARTVVHGVSDSGKWNHYFNYPATERDAERMLGAIGATL